MTTPDFSLPWYHGSQRELTVIRSGSSVSQSIDVARAFSHRPSLLGMSDDGNIHHNGVELGFLHVVDEPITEDDIKPHPHQANALKWEWLVQREIRVRLIERTEPLPEQKLTPEAERTMRQRGGSHYDPDR